MVSAVSETLKEGKEFLQAEDQVPEKEVFQQALKGKDESYLQKVSKITRNMGRLTRLTHSKKARMAGYSWQIFVSVEPILEFVIGISIHGVTPGSEKCCCVS